MKHGVMTIVGDTPSSELLKDQDLSFTTSLRLSDPNFAKPGGVDLLLGQDVLVHILTDGLVKSSDGKLFEIYTIFGWVIGGYDSCVL